MGWFDRVNVFSFGKGNKVNISQKNTINGEIVIDNNCQNISIENGVVLIDGINITENLSKYKDINITIVINGSVEKVYSDNDLNLTVNGSISECVSLGSGRINSKSINGNISIKEDGTVNTNEMNGNIALDNDGRYYGFK